MNFNDDKELTDAVEAVVQAAFEGLTSGQADQKAASSSVDVMKMVRPDADAFISIVGRTVDDEHRGLAMSANGNSMEVFQHMLNAAATLANDATDGDITVSITSKKRGETIEVKPFPNMATAMGDGDGDGEPDWYRNVH